LVNSHKIGGKGREKGGGGKRRVFLDITKFHPSISLFIFTGEISPEREIKNENLEN
jgi:hypothetical protein